MGIFDEVLCFVFLLRNMNFKEEIEKVLSYSKFKTF